MNLSPTCPKCFRPYWNDGSQTAVPVCKCVDHTTTTPLIVNAYMQALNLLNEINKKLDGLKATRVQAKVKPACETLQIIDEMLREAYILKEHKDYIYNLDNAERLRGYKLALQRLKQKIVSK